ncbi:hypothetical protein AKUH4B505J_01110 [Apilactobacillus kunkeei]|uniref:hypothetical protein n=1 Tax=Apilactobacillus kunkeei TaxID=148814 RepID=UPI0006C8950D|nr:hypothetical protein [Apilactobacillus kunkeei]CAI2614164.1 hypothetical protein AKUH4B505J_01110 [Apilactobacillus kunkeei]
MEPKTKVQQFSSNLRVAIIVISYFVSIGLIVDDILFPPVSELMIFISFVVFLLTFVLLVLHVLIDGVDWESFFED